MSMESDSKSKALVPAESRPLRTVAGHAGIVVPRVIAEAGDQARALLESIDTSTLVGLRDRALIGVMTYDFARIGAVVAMRVEDYFANGKRWWSASTRKAASAMRCRHQGRGHRRRSQSPSSAPPSAAPVS